MILDRVRHRLFAAALSQLCGDAHTRSAECRDDQVFEEPFRRLQRFAQSLPSLVRPVFWGAMVGLRRAQQPVTGATPAGVNAWASPAHGTMGRAGKAGGGRNGRLRMETRWCWVGDSDGMTRLRRDGQRGKRSRR